MPRTIKYQDEKGSNNENEIMETQNHRPRRKPFFWILIIALIALGAWALSYFNLLPGDNTYQAVFLNNGQVYFGKLSRVGSQYPVLEDIYYLQITQPLQPGDGTAPNTDNSQSNINLVKLGGELHGPEDEMRINRDSILFIEKLKGDSTVVQNINKLKEQESR